MSIIDTPSAASKGRPQAPWPPPLPVRRVLQAARRCYHATRKVERPPLNQAANAVGLFTLPDLLVLAQSSYWPLPDRAIQFIAQSPEDRARRHRRRVRFASGVASQVVADETPALLSFLQGARRQ